MAFKFQFPIFDTKWNSEILHVLVMLFQAKRTKFDFGPDGYKSMSVLGLGIKLSHSGLRDKIQN